MSSVVHHPDPSLPFMSIIAVDVCKSEKKSHSFLLCLLLPESQADKTNMPETGSCKSAKLHQINKDIHYPFLILTDHKNAKYVKGGGGGSNYY